MTCYFLLSTIHTEQPTMMAARNKDEWQGQNRDHVTGCRELQRSVFQPTMRWNAARSPVVNPFNPVA